MRKNSLLLSCLVASVALNVFTLAKLRNVKENFLESVRYNITAHTVSGRLDHVKSQFKTLIDNNLSIDIDPNWLYQAVHYGHSDILEYFLESGRNPKFGKDAIPLLDAFKNNDVKTIKILIKHHLKFSPEDLANAAYWGSSEIVQMIINSSKFQSIDFTNALFSSLSFCPSKKIVEILVQNGANLVFRNTDPIDDFDLNKTPLEMATYRAQNFDRKDEWRNIKAYLEAQSPQPR